MSLCPTDGPVLKSILGLYRPPLIVFSLLLFRCFNILSLSICSSPLLQPTAVYPPIFLLYAVSISLPYPSLLHPPFSPSWLTVAHIQHFSLFFGVHCTNHLVSSQAQPFSLSVSASPSSYLVRVIRIVSFSTDVSLSGN